MSFKQLADETLTEA
jgi:hypothetical protein